MTPTSNDGESGDDRSAPDGADDAGRTDDPLTWETVDSRVAYDCPGFEVHSQTVELPDGTETDFDYLSEPPAVVVLALTVDGRAVVIEEWRQAVGRVNRGLPAGTVEPDDADLVATAHRELREETGYEADAVEHLVTVEPANGCTDAVHHCFLATGCTPTAEQSLDADESIRVDTTPLSTLRSAVASGSIRDGRAVTAVGYHALREQ